MAVQTRRSILQFSAAALAAIPFGALAPLIPDDVNALHPAVVLGAIIRRQRQRPWTGTIGGNKGPRRRCFVPRGVRRSKRGTGTGSIDYPMGRFDRPIRRSADLPII